MKITALRGRKKEPLTIREWDDFEEGVYCGQVKVNGIPMTVKS